MDVSAFDPGRVMSEVEDGAGRLEKAADTYYAAVKRFEDAEAKYEMAMAIERTKVYEQHDGKIAADLRNDYALKRLDPEVRTEYAAARADKEALTVRFRALAAAVSARQSLLKALQGCTSRATPSAPPPRASPSTRPSLCPSVALRTLSFIIARSAAS